MNNKDKNLLSDIRRLIESARQGVAHAADSGLVLLNWSIGKRIRRDILNDARAAYGKQILPTLSAKLVPEYGQGFTERGLGKMIQFVQVFPNPKIVQTLSAKLGWSHFVELLPLKDSLKRDFYTEMCRVEGWNVRTLREKSGIRVAQYMTELPPIKLLEKKFHQAVRIARQKIENK